MYWGFFLEFLGLDLLSMSAYLWSSVASSLWAANQAHYVMEFTGSETFLSLFPDPLGTDWLYHIWRAANGLNLFKPWSLNAWAPCSFEFTSGKMWRMNLHSKMCFRCKHPTGQRNNWVSHVVWAVEWTFCRRDHKYYWWITWRIFLWARVNKMWWKKSLLQSVKWVCKVKGKFGARGACVKKGSQTSNFLCEHLLQTGKAKPLCGYQKSDQ